MFYTARKQAHKRIRYTEQYKSEWPASNHVTKAKFFINPAIPSASSLGPGFEGTTSTMRPGPPPDSGLSSAPVVLVSLSSVLDGDERRYAAVVGPIAAMRTRGFHGRT